MPSRGHGLWLAGNGVRWTPPSTELRTRLPLHARRGPAAAEHRHRAPVTDRFANVKELPTG
eukprot:7293579-Prymnesium_polylepis.2